MWAAAAVAVLMTVLRSACDLGGAVAGPAPRGGAADLAALAAAGHAVYRQRRRPAPARRGSPTAMGTGMARAASIGWDALVEVRVSGAAALPGLARGGRGRALPRRTAIPPGGRPVRRAVDRVAATCGSRPRRRRPTAGERRR